MLSQELRQFSFGNFPSYLHEHQKYNSESSSFFSHLVKDRSGKPDLFSEIQTHVKSLFSNNAHQCITVAGPPSVGKTLLLTDLYLHLLEKQQEYVPIYINLHRIEDEIAQCNGHKNEAIALKNRFFANWKTLTEEINKEKIPVAFIVDGVDQYQRTKQKIDNKFLGLLKEIEIPKAIIVGLGSHNSSEYPTHKGNKTRRISNIPRSYKTFILQDKSVFHDDLDSFLERFLKWTAQHRSGIFSDNKNDIVEALGYLKGKITQFSYRWVNCFTLWLLLEKRDKPFDNSETLSEYYRNFILEEINVDDNASDTDLNELAKIVFSVIIKGAAPDDLEKKYQGFKFIHKHQSIRDYLVAIHVVNQLENKNALLPENKDLDYLYDYGINRFCKEILFKLEANTQAILAKAIRDNFDNYSMAARTYFVYLLGRFELDSIRRDCKSFLNNELEKANTELNKETERGKSELLYRRALYISLMYLGEPTAAKDYITELINDSKNDQLNRGFHLEYYGDLPYVPTSPGMFGHVDDLGRCDRTFDRLYHKCMESLNGTPNRLLELELYTLGSLVQHRHASQKFNLSETQIERTKSIIAKALKNGRVISTKVLYRYLRMLQINLKFKRFNPMSITRLIYRLKTEARAGWEIRSLKGIESVAEHTWGAYTLALVLLPEKIIEGHPLYSKSMKYDKSEILDLLFAHDIPEALTGDHPSNNMPPWVRGKQEEFIEYLGMLSTYEGLASLKKIRTAWKKFSTNSPEEDINVALAKEIDKLENLMELHFINNDIGKQVEDFGLFKEDLEHQISNSFLRNAMEKLIDSYSSDQDLGLIFEAFEIDRT
ncbi:MAG TPA: hypothetical protein DCE41_04105 [Cytophagales bacterium]|nr:hypothetical protein [Cytophagales bacterium]HAP59334.1 hypothetical protein [Cytophagales bacterium]